MFGEFLAFDVFCLCYLGFFFFLGCNIDEIHDQIIALLGCGFGMIRCKMLFSNS